MSEKFERIFAVDVQKDEHSDAIIGDRIRLVGAEDDGRVHLYRESKLERVRSDGLSWDWKVDPDAGLAISEEQAAELHGALGELLGDATQRKLRTCIEALRKIEAMRARSEAEVLIEQNDLWMANVAHTALDAIGDDRGAWEKEIARSES